VTLTRYLEETQNFSYLGTEATTEMLLQVGLFFDQTEGSFASAKESLFFQAEKFLESDSTKELIRKTATSTRYFQLYLEGLLLLSTPEPELYIILEMEMSMFFTLSRIQNVDRRQLFQTLIEHPDEYPIMNQQPLFQALSHEEWPPESLRNDKSISTEIYNDRKLYQHFVKAISISASLGSWVERRLAKTPEGYLCNVDKNTQLGDQIAVVAGCRMPLILRRRGNGTFRIVGHAYVMGLMYAEARQLGIERERILLS
jgi:hypothetical protein